MPNPNQNDKGKANLLREKRGPNHANDIHTNAGFVSCKVCHNVLHNKRWQKLDGEVLLKINPQHKSVHEAVCPACEMIRRGQFGGEVIVRNVPDSRSFDVVDLILAVAKQAEEHGAEVRVIDIKKDNGEIRVTTTDNQLAVRIAKDIKSANKKSELEISYSPEPHKVSRAIVDFK